MAARETSGFAKRLGDTMRAAGLSQNQLETDAGLPSGYVSRLLSGERGDRMSLDILRAISEVLEVSTDWLIKGFDKDPYPERAAVVRYARAKKIPPEVVERLYGPKYEGRADLRREGWMAALTTEQSAWLRDGMQGLKEEAVAVRAKARVKRTGKSSTSVALRSGRKTGTK